MSTQTLAPGVHSSAEAGWGAGVGPAAAGTRAWKRKDPPGASRSEPEAARSPGRPGAGSLRDSFCLACLDQAGPQPQEGVEWPWQQVRSGCSVSLGDRDLKLERGDGCAAS